MSATCEFCHKTFTNERNMGRHAEKFHFAYKRPESKRNKQPQPQCPICRISGTKSDLIDHFLLDHSIEIVRETQRFETIRHFQLWKTQTEKETVAQFVKPRAENHRKDGSQNILYNCSRNGYSTPKGTVKQKQVNGSVKIQGYCPAAMSVDIGADGSVSVDYVKTHVGHSLDLKFIRLTTEERKEIARKIAANVPYNDILDDIRESVNDDNLERMHLIKRQDLFNVERSLPFLQSNTQTNDFTSVESWVQEMRPSGLILYYKGQQQDSPCDVQFSQILEKEDFFLVISNDHQLEMLKRFGSKFICVVRTHELNAYGFELTTIVILDDLNEGFPVAFLISNRADEPAMQLFFEVVAEANGERLCTDVLMTDVAEAHYNGWIKVFPNPKKRLFCSWQVVRDWRENLKKIENNDRAKEVNDELRVLLEEKDVQTFSVLLDCITDKWLDDADLKDFGEYFVAKYKTTYHSWAYCHHQHDDLNSNMHLERMHNTLKYIYLHRSNVKRIDKTLDALIKFTRDRFEGMKKSAVMGKHTVATIRKRHFVAVENLTTFQVTDAGVGVWECSSSNGRELYRVVKNTLKEPCSCELRCDYCQECIHSFICACHDSSIKWHMCQHIHAVCIQQSKIRRSKRASRRACQKRTPEEPAVDSQSFNATFEDLATQVDIIDQSEESGSTLVSEVSVSTIVPEDPGSSSKSIKDYKRGVIALLSNIQNEVMNSTTFEELETIENLLQPAVSYCRRLRTARTVKESKQLNLHLSTSASKNNKILESTANNSTKRKLESTINKGERPDCTATPLKKTRS